MGTYNWEIRSLEILFRHNLPTLALPVSDDLFFLFFFWSKWDWLRFLKNEGEKMNVKENKECRRIQLPKKEKLKKKKKDRNYTRWSQKCYQGGEKVFVGKRRRWKRFSVVLSSVLQRRGGGKPIQPARVKIIKNTTNERTCHNCHLSSY